MLFPQNHPSCKHHEKNTQRKSKQFQQRCLRKKRNRKERQKLIQEQKQKKTNLIYQMHQTIHHHFPKLFDWMREIDDCRKKKSTYELVTLLTACLAMYIFKSGSRNAFNELRDDAQFEDNYEKLFKLPLPHLDTVDRVMRLLPEQQIEQLKQKMLRVLLRRKIFHKSRFRNKWFRIAVDGSGVMSFDHKHCGQCLHKTSKKGKTTYSHHVMEARLIMPNGFSISLATEWIENPEGGEYEKQDCERKAFLRLAEKLKKAFPQLPILILADGLYPYKGFFETCKNNKWSYVATFEEGNLPTIWRKVALEKTIQTQNKKTEKVHLPGNQPIEERVYCWVNNLNYKGHILHWLECNETITHTTPMDEPIEYKRFVHITDLKLTTNNIADTSQTGRHRWKIENEGFNTLKNGGYEMKHKYSRKSYRATKNYYQFMQMAYLINQLMVKTIQFKKDYLDGKNHKTLKSLWQQLIAAMQWVALESSQLEAIETQRVQYRFVS